MKTIHDKINKVFNSLSELSGRDSTNRWEKAGASLSRISGGYRDVGMLAYAFLENHNFHGACAVLNWMFNLYEIKYMSEVKNIKWEIEHSSHIVRTTIS